ncbi:response regulator [Neotamlana laminarinivorans]|uniref:Response regulator transcription factor n=1 Tax=Neotamlana laminarinivorans TaxID=2883124 RepID=A0A9X1HYV0_9FLAO|nr:response regulator transcription factor [Tamlana laminarinivorans]MCB4798286.1 response regulator transcription factor [Tamlana laminarinivorans]
MKPIKLIIADDHELFRNGLNELLKKYDDVHVVALVEDGNQLFQELEKHKDIAIVLLDITMPNMDGFQVLNKLKNSDNNIKPVVISMHDEGNYIASCAKNGAYSYLLKNTDQDELIKTIRIVNDGKKYFQPQIAEKMINYMSEQSVSENILSNKEKEVLGLISKGLTTKEIAKQLFVSSRTIETHRANIIKKLEVKNTAELIKKATEINLI